MHKRRIDPRQRGMNYCEEDEKGSQGIVGILVANYKRFLWEFTCRHTPWHFLHRLKYYFCSSNVWGFCSHVGHPFVLAARPYGLPCQHTECNVREHRTVQYSTIQYKTRTCVLFIYLWLLTSYFSMNISLVYHFYPGFFICGGTRWRIWFRHIASSRKVAGSIADGVIGISYWHNPSGRTMVLGLTQPLTEMSTRNTSWVVKGGRCVGLTTLPPSCADCLKIWHPQPPGTLWTCPGL
jgi:hypothetical protein